MMNRKIKLYLVGMSLLSVVGCNSKPKLDSTMKKNTHISGCIKHSRDSVSKKIDGVLYTATRIDKSIDSLYNQSKTMPLPIMYSFPMIVDQPDFSSIPSTLNAFFHLEELDGLKMIKLPADGLIKPILVTGYDPGSGEVKLNLETLTKENKVINTLVLFSNNNEEGTDFTTFTHISNEYHIEVKKVKFSTEKVEQYKIQKDGTIVKVN